MDRILFGARHRRIAALNHRISCLHIGGRGEIRTHETVSRLAVFKTAALNHSATLPELVKSMTYAASG
jgi:hypothetical protein